MSYSYSIIFDMRLNLSVQRAFSPLQIFFVGTDFLQSLCEVRPAGHTSTLAAAKAVVLLDGQQKRNNETEIDENTKTEMFGKKKHQFSSSFQVQCSSQPTSGVNNPWHKITWDLMRYMTWSMLLVTIYSSTSLTHPSHSSPKIHPPLLGQATPPTNLARLLLLALASSTSKHQTVGFFIL